MHNKHFRLLLVLLSVVFFLSLLMARFYTIQMNEGEKWQKAAKRQHYFSIKEPALRGTFYSNGSVNSAHPDYPKKLVVDIQKFHLHLDPQSIPIELKTEIKEKLFTFLALSKNEKKILSAQFQKKSRNRKLASWLAKEKQDSILQWWRPYAAKHKIPHNALFFVSDYQRSYPYGHLLGQLLHTIRDQKDELSSHSIPTGGLELYFDQYLKGSPGKRELMRSPKNSFEIGEIIESPKKGADIYLTINHHLQAILEEELEKSALKAKAECGRAVMMNPYTGEILAIAHYPFFDPARYQEYFNNPKMKVNVEFGALTDAIEPGSTMKAFSACVGIMANKESVKNGKGLLFDPLEKMATSNGRFPGRSKPLEDTRLHYFMNLQTAVQKSANIYLARVIEKVIASFGSPWYRNVLQDTFGFGKKTGIEFPVETSGVLPVIGKRHRNGTLEWSTCTPFSLSMGYNLQVNSVQLCRAYAVLANGGIFVNPTFVKKIVQTDENGVETILVDNTLSERKQSFPRVLDKETVNEVTRLIKYTTKPGGSAPKAEIYGYSEAGKTGTSKKVVNGVYKDIYRASFIGFAPVENPAFVLYVMLDEPSYGFVRGVGKTHHGGTYTARLFSRIGKRALAYLGVEPDDPYGYPNGDPRADSSKADWIKEAKELQQTYQSWNQKK